ncbi:Uncharacterised protein [Klebsiella pneumoniae]|nr:Uncharacterised protein [Klebsiella pneumoniae]SWJ07621.1 Uncharacterised protein [Klebsiella pneumoniae]
MLRGKVEPATRPAISNGKMYGVSDIWLVVVLSGVKAVHGALVADKSNQLKSPGIIAGHDIDAVRCGFGA